jgi:succinoglycan biosynthesis protein ExoM
LRYIHEPRRGISMARNAILEAALDLSADWVAFIDDDETAAPNWLAELMAAAKRYNADVVQGRVEPIYPEPTPFWIVPPKSRADGHEKGAASTNNVMFSSWIIRADGLGLRFSERFALTGGEDTDFFARAYDAGAKIAHSNKPLVFEHWSVERCSYMAQVSRSFHASVNDIRRHGGFRSAGRAAIKAVGSAIMGVLLFIRAILCVPISRTRFKKEALRGGKRIAAAAGRIAALTGYRAEPYRRTTGY